MTQEKSMLCYISMTRNSRLGQIDRKSHIFGKAFCLQFSPFDTKGSQHSGLYGNRTVWRWWRTAQTPSLGWSCAYKTWYGVASAASEPVRLWLEKSCDYPSVTLRMWAGFHCMVCTSMFDSEKVCIAYTPSMRHLSYKPVCRHRILILLPSSCLGISTVNGLCQLGVFSSSFSRKSSEDDQEGRESIFLSCDDFAGLAALKSIKTSFFFLPKSADPTQNAEKDWLCGIKPCYYYLEIVPLQDRKA